MINVNSLKKNLRQTMEMLNTFRLEKESKTKYMYVDYIILFILFSLKGENSSI